MSTSRPPVYTVTELKKHIITIDTELSISRNNSFNTSIETWDFNYWRTRIYQELDRLEAIPPTKDNPDRYLTKTNSQGLRSILAERHLTIAGSPKDYILSPNDVTNKLFLLIATSISSAQGRGRYKLLMPSLEFTYSKDILFNDIEDEDNKLRNFVPADGNKNHLYTRLIYVIQTLQYFETTGQFLHLITSENDTGLLSATEIDRVKNHSKYTKAYYDAICKLHEGKRSQVSFGSVLQSLSSALIDGGLGMTTQKHDAILAAKKRGNNKMHDDVYKNETLDQFQIPNRSNAAMNAQASANIAIAEFLMWYENLSREDKDKFNEITAKKILEILFKLKNLNPIYIIKTNKKPDKHNIQQYRHQDLYVRYKNELYFISKDFTVDKNGKAQSVKSKKDDDVYKFICIDNFEPLIEQFDAIVGNIRYTETILTIEQCFKITELIGHANHNVFSPGNCVVLTSGIIDTLINEYTNALFSTYPSSSNPEKNNLGNSQTYQMLKTMCQLKYDELKFWMGLEEYPISKAKKLSATSVTSELTIPVEISFDEAVISTRTKPKEIEQLLAIFFKNLNFSHLQYFRKNIVNIEKIDFAALAIKINADRHPAHHIDKYFIIQKLMENNLLLDVNNIEKALIWIKYIDKGNLTESNIHLLRKFVKNKNDILFILNHKKLSLPIEIVHKLPFYIDNVDEYIAFCQQLKQNESYFQHTKEQCAKLINDYESLDKILNASVKNFEIIPLCASAINSFMTQALLDKFIRSHNTITNLNLIKILDNDLDDKDALFLYFQCLDKKGPIEAYRHFPALFEKKFPSNEIEIFYSKMNSNEKILFIEIIKNYLPELVQNGDQLAFYVDGIDKKAVEIFKFIDVKKFINDLNTYIKCAKNHAYQNAIISDVFPILIEACSNLDNLISILKCATNKSAELVIQHLINNRLLTSIVNDVDAFIKLSAALKNSLLMRTVIEHFNAWSVPIRSFVTSSKDLVAILTNSHYSMLTFILQSVDLPSIIQNQADFNFTEKCLMKNNQVESETAYTYFHITLAPYICRIKNIQGAHRRSINYPDNNELTMDSNNINVNVSPSGISTIGLFSRNNATDSALIDANTNTSIKTQTLSARKK